MRKYTYFFATALVATMLTLSVGCSTSSAPTPSPDTVPVQEQEVIGPRPHPTPPPACDEPTSQESIVVKPTAIVSVAAAPAKMEIIAGSDFASFSLKNPNMITGGTKDTPNSFLAPATMSFEGSYVLLLRSDDDGQHYYLAGGQYGVFRDEGGQLFRQCLTSDFKPAEATQPIELPRLIEFAS